MNIKKISKLVTISMMLSINCAWADGIPLTDTEEKNIIGGTPTCENCVEDQGPCTDSAPEDPSPCALVWIEGQAPEACRTIDVPHKFVCGGEASEETSCEEVDSEESYRYASVDGICIDGTCIIDMSDSERVGVCELARGTDCP